MSTKTLGGVGWGLVRQKVEIELGSGDFYPNSIPTGDVSNLGLVNTLSWLICLFLLSLVQYLALLYPHSRLIQLTSGY